MGLNEESCSGAGVFCALLKLWQRPRGCPLDVGTESEIVPGVCEIINLSVFVTAIPCKARRLLSVFLSLVLYNSHTHIWSHTNTGLCCFFQPPTVTSAPWVLLRSVFLTVALTCSHTPMTHITSLHTGPHSLPPPAACSYIWPAEPAQPALRAQDLWPLLLF